MQRIPLEEVEWVLLDMDGTLLDKYFDDYFWEHLLPGKYAEKKNITFGRAKEELLGKYEMHLGTLNWTDIDFWSKEVEIDIPALKEQIRHLIEVHPHVEDFLKMLRAKQKKIHLLTNAHYKVLDLKMKKTSLGQFFDSAITSFEIGYAKEQLAFWKRAQDRIGFDNRRTLFIDDTLAVLRTARDFGVRYLLYKSRASSRAPEKPQTEFPVLDDFGELL